MTPILIFAVELTFRFIIKRKRDLFPNRSLHVNNKLLRKTSPYYTLSRPHFLLYGFCKTLQ